MLLRVWVTLRDSSYLTEVGGTAEGDNDGTGLPGTLKGASVGVNSEGEKDVGLLLGLSCGKADGHSDEDTIAKGTRDGHWDGAYVGLMEGKGTCVGSNVGSPLSIAVV